MSTGKQTLKGRRGEKAISAVFLKEKIDILKYSRGLFAQLFPLRAFKN